MYRDQKYGSKVNKWGELIALWAHTLEFEHPPTDEIMQFVSKPPQVYPWELWNDQNQVCKTSG